MAINTTIDSVGETLWAASRGEDWAITQLAHDFLPGLASFARRRGVEDPEDLANWVFFEALRNLDPVKAQAPGQFQAYMQTIATRRIADHYRRKSSRPQTANGDIYEVVLDQHEDVASRFEGQVEMTPTYRTSLAR